MTSPLTVVALHGFVGSGEDFDVVREAVARARGTQATPVTWVTPDLPGHGDNLPPSPQAYTVPAMAASVAGLLRSRGVVRPVLLGYSMGGRVALRLALDWPDTISALVLIGAHPGIASPSARALRAGDDGARAARIREIGAAAFCAEWATVPLIATQQRVPEPYRSAMVARRAANDTHGLQLAAEVGGTGSMEPMWERLPSLRVPTLLVTGAEDAAYRELVARILPRVPSARPATLPGAGHAAHVEAPDAFAARLAGFLDELPPIG